MARQQRKEKIGRLGAASFWGVIISSSYCRVKHLISKISRESGVWKFFLDVFLYFFGNFLVSRKKIAEAEKNRCGGKIAFAEKKPCGGNPPWRWKKPVGRSGAWRKENFPPWGGAWRYRSATACGGIRRGDLHPWCCLLQFIGSYNHCRVNAACDKEDSIVFLSALSSNNRYKPF